MKRLVSTLALAGLSLAPELALAHPGHGNGAFASGLLHPLTGADHLAAMLLVGLGAAVFLKRSGWVLPLAFLGGLTFGFVTGTWLPGSAAEAGIMASLVVLGLAAAFQVRTPAAIAAFLVAAFGYAHGASHGIEMPHDASPPLFAGGFLATSALLHFGGYALARVLPNPALRLIGAGSAGFGLVLAGIS
ncbi:HupE/UreJ family protein [Novosphingobium sp. PY1]|uniref:Putative urease/membrane protein n=1 Tax=Ochrobactrum sp. PW1 TaxID=1882222 RepID=A0A292GNC6_9HYPH|nr:HupE/UreJ family protein [Novosphingobium sp. PY1]BBA74358.1 putative urease/membrane protein [Ochrobactrum sp. PW1]GFM29207.1 putative urease/membrane protein [Novosphingobium sp. PY1]